MLDLAAFLSKIRICNSIKDQNVALQIKLDVFLCYFVLAALTRKLKETTRKEK